MTPPADPSRAPAAPIGTRRSRRTLPRPIRPAAGAFISGSPEVATGRRPRGHVLGIITGKPLAVAVGLVVAVLAPAGAASARSTDWTPLVYPTQIDGACGSIVVHVTFPYVKEFQRFLPQPDGTVVQQVTGTDYTTFSTDDGASITVNLSGPGKNVLYPNGDVETIDMGRYGTGLSPEQAAELGTPQIFFSTGKIDFITHPDGSITPITVPHNVTDICAALGAG
jgi:hypothetical protein